ncbi:hypothetical protein ACE193_17180 [Bernardetia sp. OM2101]|uniref:hypothetical protein n=1 Tax=Bernardetia sp. OM2101 TaxID=3344876 RepID=UPI0035D00B08
MKNTILIIFSLLLLFFSACNSDKQVKEVSNPDSLQVVAQKITQDSLKKIMQESFELGDTSFRIPSSKRFDVDNVQIAKEFLAINEGKKVFENQLNRELIFMPKEHQNADLVSAYNNRLYYDNF